MKKTLNQIVEYIRTFSTNHAQVNQFSFGDIVEISQINDTEVTYPLIHVQVDNSTIEENHIILTLNCLCMDLTNKDEDNTKDVLSDTLLILNDLKAWFSKQKTFHDVGIHVLNPTPILPFTEKFMDEVAGFNMVLKLKIDNRNVVCNIPTSVQPAPLYMYQLVVAPINVYTSDTFFGIKVNGTEYTLPSPVNMDDNTRVLNDFKSLLQDAGFAIDGVQSNAHVTTAVDKDTNFIGQYYFNVLTYTPADIQVGVKTSSSKYYSLSGGEPTRYCKVLTISGDPAEDIISYGAFVPSPLGSYAYNRGAFTNGAWNDNVNAQILADMDATNMGKMEKSFTDNGDGTYTVKFTNSIVNIDGFGSATISENTSNC